jgi:hypothetical protein
VTKLKQLWRDENFIVLFLDYFIVFVMFPTIIFIGCFSLCWFVVFAIPLVTKVFRIINTLGGQCVTRTFFLLFTFYFFNFYFCHHGSGGAAVG